MTVRAIAGGANTAGRFPFEARLPSEAADFGRKAVEACNKSVAALESRVLIYARRLRDLKAAPRDVSIETFKLVERTARALRAIEFSPLSDGNKQ